MGDVQKRPVPQRRGYPTRCRKEARMPPTVLRRLV